MSAREQALFWLTAIVSLVVVLALFEGILLPIITGFAVAYFLDLSVDCLERRGVPRSLGATFILGGFSVVLAIGLFAGGSLCRFVGVLLAVPVAAVVGVLSRFMLQHYLSSRIFLCRDLNQVDDSP